MKALVWHGRKDVRVDTVADPKIEADTDVIIRVTSTAICGSDLHLYDVLTPFLKPGDILGMNPWVSSRRWVPVCSIFNPVTVL